jgi:hypothetical protein
LKKIWGPQILSFFLFGSSHEVCMQLCLTLAPMIYLTTGLKAIDQLTTNWNSETVNQNKPSFLISWLSLIFCYSDIKLTNTMMMLFKPSNSI